MTDVPWLPGQPDPSRPARPPRKARNTTPNPAASRRGRNNRKRGTADELVVARLLGGLKVGELGLPWDIECPGWLRVQAKKLDRWPSIKQVLELLDAIPQADELRAVTLADTPGPGGRTRRIIVFDLAEFAAWYGNDTL